MPVTAGRWNAAEPEIRAYADKGFDGGEGGIRTLGRLTPTPDFESGTFDHSATSPVQLIGVIIPFPGAFWLATCVVQAETIHTVGIQTDIAAHD